MIFATQTSRFKPAFTLSLIMSLTGSVAQAEDIQLALDNEQAKRLGVKFEAAAANQSIVLARVPGVTQVLPGKAMNLVIPFDTHIEGWAAQPGQHLTRGQPLVSLHSHDAFEFFRAHARLNSELSLCNERLANLQQRQRSGLSSRLDVMEKTIACQALEDERLSRTQVLEHVPTAWQTQQGAEFDWALPQNGWVMSLNAREGDRAEGHQPLAEFWPDDQLAVGFSLKATLAQAVTTGSRIQVQATNSNRVVAMRVVQRSDHPDASGQIQLWLQPDDTTSAAAQLQPGERWQVAVPSAVTGWVTPASARIRSEGQSWVFERTTTGVQVRAIEPLAEGDQQLLLAANSFDSTPELAVIGTAALTSYWQASQEEAK